MDTMTPAPGPIDNSSSPAPKRQGGIGPLVGIIVIIILLAAGGYYFFRQAQLENAAKDQAADPETAALERVSSSDEVPAIEGDLEATAIGSLESDLSQMESEF